MPYVLIAIIIIWIIVSLSKKRYRKKREQIFTSAISTFLDECSSNFSKYEEGFQMAYERSLDILIEFETISRDSLSLLQDNTLLDRIPKLKKEYAKIVQALSTLEKDNTVLIPSEKENERLETMLDKMDLFEQEKKISNDVIKTAPYLAMLVETHAAIYDIFESCNPFVLITQYLLTGLKNEDVESKEFKATWELCSMGYRVLTSVYGWMTIKTKYPKYNTSENKSLFEKEVGETTDYPTEWLSIWYKNMSLILEKNGVFRLGDAWSDLYHFTNNALEEAGKPDWLAGPWLPVEYCIGHRKGCLSSLRAEDHTRKDLMRIHNLYQSGQMTGEYQPFNDPKYINKT